MSFKKQTIDNYLLYDTPVENIFISEFAKEAPGDYVKVYLFAFMYADLGLDLSNEKLAGALSMSPGQISDAWDYWKECGLVNIRENKGSSDKLQIEFVNIKEKFFSKAPSRKAQSSNVERLNDREIAELYSSIEKETGRLLESKEPEAVAVWLRDFGMKPEVILLGYRQSVKNGKSTRYRYVEKILMAWYEKGLDSAEKVEDYLSETDRKYDFYRKVFKALGFRRNPTQAEMDVMDRWETMGFSLADVLEACKKTSGISNPSINYIHSILAAKKEKEDSESAENNAKLQQAVEERYERIREANSRKAEALRERIYSEVPRLRDVQDELRSSGFKISKSILKGAAGKAELAEARDLQDSLTEEKRKLLSENGYKENALDSIYTCSKCSDTGFLEDGTRCSCYYERLTEVKNERRNSGQ